MSARARLTTGIAVLAAALGMAACAADGPSSPAATSQPSLDRRSAPAPTVPPFDLNVQLRGADESEGSIKFRQPNDGVMTIFLHTKVEGLAPNHDFYLQRAAIALGGGCVDGGWLTLGLGTVVTPIHTDEEGEGRADLFRSLPASFAGKSFDIHFQIVDAVSGAVVLQSKCLAYTANPN
jgi:hypothetical protein